MLNFVPEENFLYFHAMIRVCYMRVSMKRLSLAKLETFLKSQCDALRGSMDASEYKDYLIAMIFLKRVNDQFTITQEHFKKELKHTYPDISEDDLLEAIEDPLRKDKYDFFVPPLARWKMKTLPKAFEKEQYETIKQAEEILSNPKSSEQEKTGAKSDIDGARKNLSFKGLLFETEDIGNSINIALKALEKSNDAVLQGVLTGKEGNSTNFNETNTNGERKLSDEVLSEMINDFNNYTLTDDNFEFPDLMGAAYEFLIKYFAESAGKKGGEFYTPHQVVELMGRILKPAKNAMICDPTVGSGGLLINMKNYVEAVHGSAKDLYLFGQESKEGTYKMCKMNMIFHGIKNANIHHCDTLLNPTLIKDGKLIKYDIVVANPPFSQNYTIKNMKFTDRFSFWMSKKKQADFMFVQHMISTLKANGRMAVIMPHGVLFRGGEEQKMRKWLITGIIGESNIAENLNTPCILEAVIGLPPSLFYGTGIPASILVINKSGAFKRKGVLFINADREYKEGKNQNILRPEDIDKISYVYTEKDTTDSKYSRLVTKEELEAEDFNCNIRRWVDNAPEPDNQDVEAHLSGGMPKLEVDALDSCFNSFYGLKNLMFKDLKEGYYRFSDNVENKESIKDLIINSNGYKSIKKSYHERLDGVWKKCQETINDLPNKSSIQYFVECIRNAYINDMYDDEYPVLNLYQGRGAIAQFFTELKYDFMSVVSSGWNAELIPDEEILESQFPEVLQELRDSEARRDEIQGMFDTANEMENEEGWEPEDFDITSSEVFPKTVIKNIKADIKINNTEKRTLEKELKILDKRIKAYEKDLRKNLSPSELAKIKTQIVALEQDKIVLNNQIQKYQKYIDEQEAKIKRNIDLEDELKECRKVIKAITQRKNQLVEEAREKISDEEAEKLIVARWSRTLHSIVDSYIEEFARNLQLDIEHIYEKYTVTLKDILSEKDKVTNELNSYLEELGYATV